MNPSKAGEFSSSSVLISPREPIDINLAEGLVVSLEEVESSAGLLSYKGRQVLLYIRDHGSSVLGAIEDGSTGRKYHVADCKVLKIMRERGRFDRYVVTNDTSEQFIVTGSNKYSGQYIEGEAGLKVCKVCLAHLNYQGYQVGGEKRTIFNRFTMDEFFSTFSSHFKHLPTKRADDIRDIYTSDWPRISSNYKYTKGYCCEKCNVNLSGVRTSYLLHTHHKDGVKSNNLDSNLIALCIDCHSKEAFHEHMFVTHEQRQMIIQLRNQQGILNSSNSWHDLFEFSDPAVHGVLHLCKKQRLSKPKVGFSINGPQSKIIAELAWPLHNLAVVLDSYEKMALERVGWKAYSTDEFIENFEQINIC
ncbi:HNH endonuclease [Vibrio rarus]|uniref:HNH endonuclease n=1 Tax=Vibrio rarus TaxID=413403 RepID=UPI0021C3100C|nr:HNH endonuclease signature motif containing protein [Vibrio rarus]